MYFTECENLVKQHPDLAGAIRRIDAQFEKMGSIGVIRAGDLSSFLRLDTNQILTILDLLANAGVLLRETMIECAHCDMAALREDFDEAMEEEDEYRCTSCDRFLSQSTIRGIVIFRRGKKWPVVSSNDDRGESAWLTVTDAARLLMKYVSGIDLDKASARVSRAAGDSKKKHFTTNGRTRTDRRIEPDSFNTWLLRQHERDLAAAENDGW